MAIFSGNGMVDVKQSGGSDIKGTYKVQNNLVTIAWAGETSVTFTYKITKLNGRDYLNNSAIREIPAP